MEIGQEKHLILGYLFDMTVTLPTIFVGSKDGTNFRANTRANLTLHRLKLNFTDLGSYTTTIQRLGKDDYTETFEMTPATQVLANRIAAVEEVEQTIPIYERNKNVTISIGYKTSFTSVTNIIVVEGDYTNKFIEVSKLFTNKS